MKKLLLLSTAFLIGAADKPLVMETGQIKQLPAATSLQLQAPTTANATINFPHGTAPSAPANGDCWTTTSGFYCRINGATVGPYSTGAGSVTSVSVTTANGVSGSVANATTTPAITLTLGAITPSSVAAVGTVTGSNLSGTNTGNQTITLTGDATGSGTGSFAVTVGKINGVALSGLATGILKNTTTTGVPSIAVAADFPTLNQSTTGSAATLTTPRAIYGNNFDGSAALTAIIASTYGGTGNGFTKFSGPAASEKTFTLPNANATLLYDGGPLGTPSSGTLTNAAGLPLTTGVTGILPGANGGTNNAFMAFSGPATSLKTYTLPNASDTIAVLGQTQTFTRIPILTSTINGEMLSITNSNASAGTAGIKINATGVSQTDWALVAGFDAGSEFALRYSTAAGGDAYVAGTSLIRYTTAGMSVTGTGSFSGGIGSTTATTQAAGDNSTKVATTAYVRAATPNASYRTLLDSSGSHTAAKVAGLYAMGQGYPLMVSGTGTLDPPNLIRIVSTDYPSADGLTAKLRIRASIEANDVAPNTNFVVALHPVTRPATSGGAGLVIYTVGTAVTGSGVTATTPAADSDTTLVGSDFALPADGTYVIAVTTNATMAASSHVHISASLQMHNQ
jgi:hypothetical protein